MRPNLGRINYSIIFQQFRGRNPKNICDLKQCFQRNTSHGSRAFHLKHKVDAFTDLFCKDRLRTCLP